MSLVKKAEVFQDEKPKSEKRQRTSYIRARGRPEDKDRLDELCKKKGISAADYIRQRCFDEVPLQKFSKEKSQKTLDLTKVLFFASKSSNNANQIARALNKAILKTGDRQEHFIHILKANQDLITSVQADIKDIRNLLRSKLLKNDSTGIDN